MSSLNKRSSDSLPATNVQSDIAYEPNNTTAPLEKIKVLLNNEVIECSIGDYIFGVVAAEMPALYEKEALKAQAVAAYTFACYRIKNNTASNYDISAEPETAQCFITRQEAAKRWGENAQEYTTKLDECISAVLGQKLTYNNQIILAAYHAISSGTTNSCKDVWGNDVPYLQSVESLDDLQADNYLTEVILTTDELVDKLDEFCAPSGNPQEYFSNVEKADSGYIKSIKYCGTVLTGSDIRSALELRSCNFEIDFSNDAFKFTVKGYGHGVGMSQTGANAMAKRGNSYEEILLYYYPGTKLEKI